MKKLSNISQSTNSDITSETYEITYANIQPLLILKEELHLMEGARVEYDQYGNAVAFIDPWFGEDGWILEGEDLSAEKELLTRAVDNINELYRSDMFGFKLINEEFGLYKFVSDFDFADVSSVLLSSRVKQGIIRIIGFNGCLVISPFGDLYLKSDQRRFDEIAINLLDVDCRNSQGGYQYLAVKNGIFETIVC